MGKNKKEIDSNVKEFFEEIETASQKKEQKLEEGEYLICPGCGEKMSKKIKACTVCGVKLKEWAYTPISEKKVKIIRWSIGIVLVVGFFLYWFLR